MAHSKEGGVFLNLKPESGLAPLMMMMWSSINITYRSSPVLHSQDN